MRKAIELSLKRERVWTYVRNDSIKWNVLKSFKLGKQIGDVSVFGNVFELDNNRNFVIKTMNLKYDRDMFYHEINVGAKPDIEKVGVRIHAYAVYKTTRQEIGIYVMDHAMSGEYANDYRDRIAISMKRYLRYNIDDDHKKQLLNLFKKTLLSFYKIAQGFHGDLHMGNVMVVLRYNKPLVYEPYKVRIIDYGSFTPFKTPLPKNATFQQAMKHIESEFAQLSHVHCRRRNNINIKETKFACVRSNKNMIYKKGPLFMRKLLSTSIII